MMINSLVLIFFQLARILQELLYLRLKAVSKIKQPLYGWSEPQKNTFWQTEQRWHQEWECVADPNELRKLGNGKKNWVLERWIF